MSKFTRGLNIAFYALLVIFISSCLWVMFSVLVSEALTTKLSIWASIAAGSAILALICRVVYLNLIEEN
jgi:hypothetical protein